MGFLRNRLEMRKQTMNKIKELARKPERLFFIHYSIENFYDKALDSNVQRVTSVAVKDYMKNKNYFTSLDQIADLESLPIEQLDVHYNLLERELLSELFNFIDENPDANWVHWNMGGSEFGFAPLEYRYQALGGSAHMINGAHVFNLAQALVDIYGEEYVAAPKLINLLERNNLSAKQLMPVDQECVAYRERDYLGLEKSMMKKVDSIGLIFNRLRSHRLKTNQTWFSNWRLRCKAMFEWIKEHPYVSLTATAFTCAGLAATVIAISD